MRMSIFQKKQSSLFSEQKQAQLPARTFVRLELHRDMICEDARRLLHSHIRLSQRLGQTVEVTELSEQTEPEYIGLESHFDGEQLTHQKRLKLQQEVCGKKTLAFQLIYPPNFEVLVSCCNNNPYKQT